jgi:hypothetical protein
MSGESVISDPKNSPTTVGLGNDYSLIVKPADSSDTKTVSINRVVLTGTTVSGATYGKLHVEDAADTVVSQVKVKADTDSVAMPIIVKASSSAVSMIFSMNRSSSSVSGFSDTTAAKLVSVPLFINAGEGKIKAHLKNNNFNCGDMGSTAVVKCYATNFYNTAGELDVHMIKNTIRSGQLNANAGSFAIGVYAPSSGGTNEFIISENVIHLSAAVIARRRRPTRKKKRGRTRRSHAEARSGGMRSCSLLAHRATPHAAVTPRWTTDRPVDNHLSCHGSSRHVRKPPRSPRPSPNLHQSPPPRRATHRPMT